HRAARRARARPRPSPVDRNVGHEPRLVHGAHRFRALFPHCGITVGGEALCWGPNDFGVTGGNFLGELTAVPWPVAQPDDDAEPVPWLP
ncbi:MAG: hypothetical protein DIU72_010290, partial [Pseudomonadota bacterium]